MTLMRKFRLGSEVKHGKIICRHCEKILFRGAKKNNLITYSECGECKKKIALEKRQKINLTEIGD